ncbi:MAG: hypothetical protein D6730_13855 [Bacteroidetes bacterium]|nr:MAG: hypothetical protein D6730_13855 [Bacteroidota bacterium]
MVGQKEVSSFKAQLNRESMVSVSQDTAAVYLMFEYDEAFELVELGAGMQVQQRYVFEKPDSLPDMFMVRLLKSGGQLLLYYQPSFKNRNLHCFRLNLEKKVFEPTGLDVPYQKEWHLLKSFVYEDKLLLLRVHEQERQLRLYAIEGETYELWTYDEPFEGFVHRLKQNGEWYIPLINYDYVLPKHNVAREKLYLSDSVLTFCMEDTDSLRTRLFQIDLSTYTAQERLFSYTDGSYNPAKCSMNASIYGDFIFQAFVPPGRKELQISIRHLESGAVLRAQSFRSDEEIVRNFGQITTRKIKERSYKDRYTYQTRLLSKMKGDIGILLENLDQEHLSFSVGFYKKQYVSPLEAAVLGASLAFNLAFVSKLLPLDNESGLSYDPFLGVFSLGYGIYGVATPNHRTFTYAQAVLDKGHLVLKHAELNASRSSKLNNYIHGQKLFRRGYGQIIFKRGTKIYYGYFLEGVYKIAEF